MAWTKINFYLTIIFSTLIIFVSLSNMGTEISRNDDITLTDRSYDYILELKGMNDNNSYTSIKDTSASDSSKENILEGEENASTSLASDYLATVFVKKERASAPTNFFTMIYYLPSTILGGIGLPVGPFAWLVNIFVYVLVLALIIMVWRDIIRT